MRISDIEKTVYKVSDFLSWQKARTLVLSPSFQRRAVWKLGAKSYLIDTIFRGLPMPIIFLREQKTSLVSFEPHREVVDGQQRIRTVISYIDASLLLDRVDAHDIFTVQSVHNKELAKKKFSELDSDAQQRILDYKFSVHVLPASVDDSEILQIFARMNSTGLKLNDQELRNAEYFGEFKTAVYELASEQLQRWRSWKIFSEDDIARMKEVELTSEFAQLMLKGVTSGSQSQITRLYKEKNEVFPERAEVERRFRIIMDTIDDKLGSEMGVLPYNKKTPFYSLFAFVYDIQFGIRSPLELARPKPLSSTLTNRIKVIGKKIEENSIPEEVKDALARRTTNIDSRLAILRYFREYSQDA